MTKETCKRCGIDTYGCNRIMETNMNTFDTNDLVEVCYINITPKRKYIVADVGKVLEITDSSFTIITNRSITKTYKFTDAISVSKLNA